MKDNIQEFMNDMGIDSYDDIAFLYQDYISECNQIVQTIENTIDTKTPSDIEKLVHNFKGVSANLYVKPVYEIAQELDMLLKDTANHQSVDSFIVNKWLQTKDTYKLCKEEIIQYFITNNVTIEDM